MTKTVRSKRSVAEITEKLVSWAKTWPTYQHIESQDHEISINQSSIGFSFTLETHPPQESPHAKDCPKGTFGSYSDCWRKQWNDQQENIPCSEQQQELCESFSDRTSISGRIEDRDYGSQAVAAIMLSIDGKPTDEASRQRMEKEINGARAFFKQLFGEDIIIVTGSSKPKIPIVDISQIARLDTPQSSDSPALETETATEITDLEAAPTQPVSQPDSDKCQRNKFGDYWNCVIFADCPPETSKKCKAKAGPQQNLSEETPTETTDDEAPTVDNAAEEPQPIQRTLSQYQEESKP